MKTACCEITLGIVYVYFVLGGISPVVHSRTSFYTFACIQSRLPTHGPAV